MQTQVTVGTKHQIVIPLHLRRKLTGIKPGKKVSVFLLNDKTIAIQTAEKSWLDRSYGAMKGKWVDDPIAEVEQMRNEWS